VHRLPIAVPSIAARSRAGRIRMFSGFFRGARSRVLAFAAVPILLSNTAYARDTPDAGPTKSPPATAPTEIPDDGAPPKEGAAAAQTPAVTPPAVTPSPPRETRLTTQTVAAASAETPAFEMVVTGRRPMTAASSFTVRDRDFLLRPRGRPADVLMVTPGLYVVQHAGGGKANQYFLRGFDADHGTDVALSVDGVPVNMVSHGHGQGYADLNWLIPEVVERIEVNKGPYFAEYGDFATAGAINLVTRRSFELSQISLGGGMFNTYRGLVVASPKLEGWHPLVAAEFYGTDGPFQNGEDLQRYNIFAKLTREFSSRSSLSLALTSYGGGWRASGQIPLREVRAGRLDRFGTVDPTEGGNSQRHSVYATYRARPRDDSEVSVMAYLAAYRLAIYSNFTFFSRDPVNGDQIEQTDARTLMGLRSSYRFLERFQHISFDTTFGAQVRNDLIANALYYDRARERLTDVVDTDIREGSLAVYGNEEITWSRWLRTIAGLRVDYFGFDVNDHLEDRTTLGTKTSGVRDAALVSPKASAVLSPLRELDFYLNFGMSYHSNDARGVVRGTDPVTPLTRAIGGEVGARTRLFDRLDLAAAFFVLNLDSEIVWVGDEGTTEARGPTRRLGGEVEARLKILPWLFADVDATLSRATFTENAGNANAVALAPTLVLSGGLSARHPDGYFGRLGVFHLGERAATEDRFLRAQGFTRVDTTLGYRHERFELSLAVQNLLNTEWREAQFANASRLPLETSVASCPAGTRAVEDGGAFVGCEDLHFTPGAPINVQATATLFF
jgi:outer membrane receptor protein involved in Fe transport